MLLLEGFHFIKSCPSVTLNVTFLVKNPQIQIQIKLTKPEYNTITFSSCTLAFLQFSDWHKILCRIPNAQ
jgi:hypothetical protein